MGGGGGRGRGEGVGDETSEEVGHEGVVGEDGAEEDAEGGEDGGMARPRAELRAARVGELGAAVPTGVAVVGWPLTVL